MTDEIDPKPKKNTVQNIHILIGLLLMFGFGFLPPFKPMTVLGMQILGTFIGLIYLLSTVRGIWPTLIGILAIGFYTHNMTNALLNAFGNSIVIQILFIMILFGGISYAGVQHYITRWFFTRKIINGRPVVFSFVLIFATYFLSALSDVMPALMLMWSILYGVLDTIGYKKSDKYTAIMIIGTFFGAITGQAAKPFTGSALAIASVLKFHIPYLPYMLFGFIMAVLTIFLYCLLIKFVFKPDMSKLANITIEQFDKDKLPPMNLQQKVLFGSIFGYIGLVLVVDLLPKTIGIVETLEELGAYGIVIAFVAVLNLAKYNNKPILNLKEVMSKYVSWNVYFVVAAALLVSSALTANNTGVKPFLTSLLNPIFGNHATFTFATIVFSFVLAQVANHGAMGLLFMPIICSFCLKNGSNLLAISSVVIFAVHLGILLPSASPFAAALFGNKDWIETKDIIKYGSVILVCCLVLYLFVAPPLLNLIF